MERLTERCKDSIANTVLIRECGDKLCKDICDDIECNCSKCELEKVLEKLATYEDLEEQGLLVRLPCKVEDTLYCIDNGIVELLIVNSFRIYNLNRIEIDFENASGFTLCTFSGELDEGYFLTYEEAAKKLEEMKNDKA